MKRLGARLERFVLHLLPFLFCFLGRVEGKGGASGLEDRMGMCICIGKGKGKGSKSRLGSAI